MKIGIDIDGVLADFHSSYIGVIRKLTGIQLPPVSDTYPDVWHYERAGGVTKKQEDEIWNHIRNSEFWGQQVALKGAPYVLDKLTQLRFDGHDIYFITSRPGKKAKFLSERWLSLHGMKNPTVLIADDKGSVAKGLQLDVFIDDKPENVVEVKQASPSTRVYLLDAPYNRDFNDYVERFIPHENGIMTEGYNVVRVKNVTTMLDREGLLAPMWERKAA